MRQYAGYILISLVVLAVAACNTTTGRTGHFPGSYDFKHYLQSGYEQLAEYEEFLDGDEEAAQHFLLKARNAKRQNGATPDMADGIALPDKEIKDVSNGYAILTDALKYLNTQENARFLAEAQVNYDCWLERLTDQIESAESDEESSPVSNKTLIESCRSMFYSAIKALHIPENMQFSVFFDSGEAIFNDQAVQTLEQVALAYIDRDLWRVRLIGRTDNTGNYEDNVILSMRRAIAVRNALAQHGVDPDRIVIEAVGAVDATPSGKANDKSHARRVDMIIAPNYIAFDHKGPDIHEIVPHFFGSEEGDM